MLPSLIIIIHSIFTACPSSQVSAPVDGSVTFTDSYYFSIFTACPSGQVSAPVDGSVTFTYSYYFESVATFTCDDGYDLIGECQLVCLSDGNWSGSKPSCTLTSK